MSNLSVISISDVSIRQDSEGRYCLNDLHKASGGEECHKPGNWLRSQQTMELINELETAQICAVSVTEGRKGGTFVVKELVYAYAMWISPSFHLKVIRAYDALAMGNTEEAKRIVHDKTATQALRMIPLAMRAARALGFDKNVAAISANQFVIKETGINVLQHFGKIHLEAENQDSMIYTPSELGLRLGVSGQKFNKLLEDADLQTREYGQWIPTEKANGYYRFLDTGKKHGDGTMVQQMKWYDTVLELVKQIKAA